MKYHFVCYSMRNRKEGKLEYWNDVTDKSIYQYIKSHIDAEEEARKEGDSYYMDPVVHTWSEISKEEYDEAYGQF